MVGVDGDADELLDEVVGSVQQRKRNRKQIVLSQELEQTKKRKPFKLRWLKESYYNTN
jgi:hypothetical protein